LRTQSPQTIFLIAQGQHLEIFLDNSAIRFPKLAIHHTPANPDAAVDVRKRPDDRCQRTSMSVESPWVSLPSRSATGRARASIIGEMTMSRVA